MWYHGVKWWSTIRKKGGIDMWFQKIVDSFKSKFQNEDGQALVEYGLLLALIAVVCIAIVTTLGTRVSGTFSDISNALPTVGGTGR
jgi:pilus assembly protein Flp/PilA